MPHWLRRRTGAVQIGRETTVKSPSPLYAAGRIYLQSEEGTGTVVTARKTFEKLATNRLDQRSLASYAIGQDFLLIRTAEHLYRIGQ